MSVLILLPLLILTPLIIIAIATLLIYTAVCNHRIKKQLNGEAIYKHRYIEPKSIIIVLLSIMLVVVFIALSCVCAYKRPDTSVDNYKSQFCTAEELELSPLSVYKNAYTQKSLNGYVREEATEDNFRYIIYRSEEDYNSMLYPTFIMFVEYTGNKTYKHSIAKDSLRQRDGVTSTGSAVLTDETTDYYFVCGNTDANANYTFTLGLYNDITIATDDFENENCLGADKLFEITI